MNRVTVDNLPKAMRNDAAAVKRKGGRCFWLHPGEQPWKPVEGSRPEQMGLCSICGGARSVYLGSITGGPYDSVPRTKGIIWQDGAYYRQTVKGYPCPQCG